MKKIIGGFKDKIVSLFKINTAKQTVYDRNYANQKDKTLEILLY